MWPLFFWYLLSCFTFWKMGKNNGILNERKENAEKRSKVVSFASSVRNSADIDGLRKKYKISRE